MHKTYAGIGSRETPPEVLAIMTDLAQRLSKQGYTLHSGGADGADTAFERGATLKNIFLPWKGFNGNDSLLYDTPLEAFDLAEQFHPAWERCSHGARALHARNCQQVLGKDLAHPVDFVLCWHNNSGGTMQACRIATHFHIPIINIHDSDWKKQMCRVWDSLLKR